MTSDWNGAPGRIRTSDPQIRSLMLYPAELRVRGALCISPLILGCKEKWRSHPISKKSRHNGFLSLLVRSNPLPTTD